MFGNGGDMALRTAAGDDNGVGQRRAALKIDGHNVFGLVVIQRLDDALQNIGRFRRNFRRGVALHGGRMGARLLDDFGFDGGFLRGSLRRFWISSRPWPPFSALFCLAPSQHRSFCGSEFKSSRETFSKGQSITFKLRRPTGFPHVADLARICVELSGFSRSVDDGQTGQIRLSFLTQPRMVTAPPPPPFCAAFALSGAITEPGRKTTATGDALQNILPAPPAAKARQIVRAHQPDKLHMRKTALQFGERVDGVVRVQVALDIHHEDTTVVFEFRGGKC